MTLRTRFTLLIFLLTASLSELAHSKSFHFCERLKTLKGDFLKDQQPPPDLSETPVTSVLVRKDLRRLYLLNHQTILKSYSVALGVSPRGHKREQGDFKTPEGVYYISLKNPHSKYHLSLKISYPNAEDLLSARKRGVHPGGDIFIHGLPNTPGTKRDLLDGIHPVVDWTLGCIAVTDEEVEEIYSVVHIGTPIEICPAD